MARRACLLCFAVTTAQCPPPEVVGARVRARIAAITPESDCASPVSLPYLDSELEVRNPGVLKVLRDNGLDPVDVQNPHHYNTEAV